MNHGLSFPRGPTPPQVCWSDLWVQSICTLRLYRSVPCSLPPPPPPNHPQTAPYTRPARPSLPGITFPWVLASSWEGGGGTLDRTLISCLKFKKIIRVGSSHLDDTFRTALRFMYSLVSLLLGGGRGGVKEAVYTQPIPFYRHIHV